VARTTRTDEAARGRAIAWRHATHEVVCDVVERWEYGTMIRCTRLPDFYVYNGLRVEGPVPALGVNTLVHAADVLLGDLDHRHVEIEEEADGARLRPGLEALGWTAERLVWMARTGAPGPAVRPPRVDEVTFAATRPLRLEWARGDWWAGSDESLQRFAAVEEHAAAVLGSRALLARDRAGTAIGYAVFVARGGGAEVEQVYVTATLRRRGVGGALVAAAVRAAGADETYIVADDEGSPKRLYERLGFEPVWRQHVFRRRPG
jgi:GNAT superfamily N-acetyltransferase